MDALRPRATRKRRSGMCWKQRDTTEKVRMLRTRFGHAECPKSEWTPFEVHHPGEVCACPGRS